MSHSRRSILGAALGLPAAVAVGTVATATPAAAAAVDATAWTNLELETGITPQPGATPQVRTVTILGTTFLQARGAITCNLAADTKIATLPAAMTPPTWYVRATSPRNNSQGINACRFEVNTAGSVTIYGATSGNPITWVQFDSVQTIWR
ncbi:MULTISPECIES: hypothetical protein [unclassified Streptomyces]|uniref:hypothetical protein n=1 Tax=unclassified Streptomyces TaxID=2593676 RepID=UPI00224E51A3|nr:MULTISPECIES: hypothetical protein [unclassified Streptomyces]MCX4987734.1 hypothetical protein [Streptomyces sp. NBC_00568]MCX5007133.1 hypothetical protein [Streptomyces sp. NBC_00638]